MKNISTHEDDDIEFMCPIEWITCTSSCAMNLKNVMHETNEELSDTRATQPNTGPGPCDGGASTSTDGDRISPYAGTLGAASLMM